MHKRFQQHSQPSGFTIVEIVVIIVVLAILITVATIGLNGYLTDSRDGQREANTSAIVDALEKFYDRSGEYPPCTAVSAAASTVTSTTLKAIDEAALVAPMAASGVTNSITCSGTPSGSNDVFRYTCVGVTACTDYTLSYYSESEETVIIKESRRG